MVFKVIKAMNALMMQSIDLVVRNLPFYLVCLTREGEGVKVGSACQQLN